MLITCIPNPLRFHNALAQIEFFFGFLQYPTGYANRKGTSRLSASNIDRSRDCRVVVNGVANLPRCPQALIEHTNWAFLCQVCSPFSEMPRNDPVAELEPLLLSNSVKSSDASLDEFNTGTGHQPCAKAAHKWLLLSVLSNCATWGCHKLRLSVYRPTLHKGGTETMAEEQQTSPMCS